METDPTHSSRSRPFPWGIVIGTTAMVAVMITFYWNSTGGAGRFEEIVDKSMIGSGETQKEDVPRGRHLFGRHCAVCHGVWGDGRGEMAATMRPRPRNFGSGIFKFRSTPSGFLPTDEDLKRTIRRGIANSSMPAFGQLSDEEIRLIVAFLKTLSSRWWHRENFTGPLAIPSEPDWYSGTDEATRQGYRTTGQRLYQELCAACHGERADGQSKIAGELADFAGEPCPPQDLTRPVLKGGTEPRDIYRVLVTGLDGTPMPSYLETLDEGQRWSLIAHLESLRRTHAP